MDGAQRHPPEAIRLCATLCNEYDSNAVRDVLIASGDPEAALLHFAPAATEEESAVLRRALRKKTSGR